MSKRYNFAAVLSIVVLLCCGALLLNQSVSAAGDGKITGMVKLDGPAPHMKGIDMSKDPYCSKAHASDPAHLETYVVGASGGLQNVVLYLSEGYSGNATASTAIPVFDQKNCVYTPHVLAMDVGQTFKVVTSDQTAHNIHPNPNPMTGNIPWNQSQPPGAPPVEKSWKAHGVYRGKVQHPSLDARLFCCGQRTVRYQRCRRQLHHQQCSARELHSDGVARSCRYADPESYSCGWRRREG